MNFLSIFVLIPLLILLGLWLSRSIAQIHAVMMTGASALLIAAAGPTVAYLQARHGGAMDEILLHADATQYPALNIHYSVNVDGISVAILLLSIIIIFTGTSASWRLQPLTKEYFLWFILLSMGVFDFFISTDLFTMFIFYEMALIPVYLLIDVWGSGCKEHATMKLTLMLMGGPAFLLTGILDIYFGSSGATMSLLEIAQLHNVPIEQQRIWSPLTFLGFGILGVLFPFHTWSPDGHAPAPTTVSMLHVDVLMKLGSCGCFRVTMYLMPEAAQELEWIFLVLANISIMCGASFVCVQTDLKYINTYSSVSHCDLVLFTILMVNHIACTGTVLQMLSHELITALFFALIGMIYGRTHTCDVREFNGLMKIMPFLAVSYVITGLANPGLPGLNSFIAEMTTFSDAFQHSDTFHRIWTVIAYTSIVITAVYILRLVGKILYGTYIDKHHLILSDTTWNERTAVIILIACVAGLGLAPLWTGNMIGDSILPIVDNLVMK